MVRLCGIPNGRKLERKPSVATAIVRFSIRPDSIMPPIPIVPCRWTTLFPKNRRSSRPNRRASRKPSAPNAPQDQDRERRRYYDRHIPGVEPNPPSSL